MKTILLSLISILNPQGAAPAAPSFVCAILDYPSPVSDCSKGFIMTSPGAPFFKSFQVVQVPCFPGCISQIGSIK